jgi:hypothetical protein
LAPSLAESAVPGEHTLYWQSYLTSSIMQLSDGEKLHENLSASIFSALL